VTLVVEVSIAMRYNWYSVGRRPRSRLRKRRKGIFSSFHQTPFSNYNSLRVTHNPSSKNRYRNEGPLFGGLHKAWLGYVIAKSQCDYEKMTKYAIAVQKFERLLNVELNEFPELGRYASGDFDNNEEDDDSKLAVIDPLTNEKIKEAKEDEDDYVEVDFDSL
jgi:hypothetical protein